VSGALIERQAALAAVALLAALASLALTRGDGTTAPGSAPVGPAETSGETWYDATVGTYGPGLYGQTTACGQRLRPTLEGVAHGVLPCGARIVVSFGGRAVDTRVVDRGPKGTGQEFSLTQALAGRLGVSGIQTIRWRFSSGR